MYWQWLSSRAVVNGLSVYQLETCNGQNYWH